MEYQPEPHENLAYCRANSMKRLANYLIDFVAFYIILMFIGFITEILFPGSVSELNLEPIEDRLITMFLYGVVMFLIETAYQGKTLGKFITGTRAVSNNGEDISIQNLLIRNFMRAVPFNALSALGNPPNPWHDSTSNTLVVDEKKLDLMNRKEAFFDDLRNQKQ